MRYILLLLILLSVVGNMLSHNTYIQKAEEGTFSLSKRHPEIYEQLKMKKYPVTGIHWELLDSLPFPKENDTIFFLQENVDIEGYLAIMLWNSKNALAFHKENGSLKKVDKCLFNKYMLKLVKEWDTIAIRREEEINLAPHPVATELAYRIIFNNKNYSVDFILFYEFFNFERDGMDFMIYPEPTPKDIIFNLNPALGDM